MSFSIHCSRTYMSASVHCSWTFISVSVHLSRVGILEPLMGAKSKGTVSRGILQYMNKRFRWVSITKKGYKNSWHCPHPDFAYYEKRKWTKVSKIPTLDMTVPFAQLFFSSLFFSNVVFFSSLYFFNFVFFCFLFLANFVFFCFLFLANFVVSCSLFLTNFDSSCSLFFWPALTWGPAGQPCWIPEKDG